MLKWQALKLKEDNENLRLSLKECLNLIDELSLLDKPLLEAELTLAFKLHYVHVVKTAKKHLK